MTSATKNKTEWVQVGRTTRLHFIGKDVVAVGAGCNLYFMELFGTRKTRFFSASSRKTGDGISYFIGHRSLNVFAYAENCSNPNIYVYNYPEFKQLNVLSGTTKEGYICIGFSEGSLLVSIGTLPYFTITVWNWRNGEKLGSSRSHIYRYEQRIRCNFNMPVRLAQVGMGTRKLHIWDILLCGKKCVMTHHKVKMCTPKPNSLYQVVWSPDGILYVSDVKGCVYQVNSEYGLDKIIDCTIPGSIRCSFTAYKDGFVVAGPNPELRFYVKQGSSWILKQTVTTPAAIINIKCNKTDALTAITDKYYVLMIDLEKDLIHFIKTEESEFIDFCMIYPTGEHICVMSHGTLLSILEIPTGNVLCKYNLQSTAISMASNPEFPYIAIGYINGILELVSMFEPTCVTSMITYPLTQNSISSVYFSEFGRVLVAADTTAGEFFILEGIPGGRIQVIATVQTGCQIADYILVPSLKCYRLFVIPVTSDEFISGKKLIRYCIMNKNDIKVKDYYFEDIDACYYKIYSTPRANRDRVFYAIRSDSKYIDEVEVRRGELNIRILRTIPTGHQTKKIQFRLDKHHALTWSYDGWIIARTADFEYDVGISLLHHRRDGGVKTAFIDPLGKYIVSLGNDNILACTNLQTEINIEKQKELKDLLESERFALLFKRKTFGFEPVGDFTWTELEKVHQNEIDTLKSQKEKAKILEEFNSIRTSLQILLNENLEAEEIEMLDLIEFNLDIRQYEEAKEKNRIECKETETYLKKFIAAQLHVCDLIKNMCWHPMQYQKRKILGIFDSVSVESFALLPQVPSEIERFEWISDRLRLEALTVGDDKFEPWKYVPLEMKNEKFSILPKVPVIKTKISDLEEESDMDKSLLDTQIALAGSTAQNFIAIAEEKYSQWEIVTFYQLQLLIYIIEMDKRRLKEHFNKQFEKLMIQKQREVSQITEKNARLRHIVSEINYFSVEKMFISIQDPKFSYTETVEDIIKVSDEEALVKPYISPSEQAILDVKAAEDERIRLLLLADDFKERALMAMMNGVLEVRWEDELKKEVLMPKCMLEKEPEDFTEDDLRTVKEYEDKVKFLNSERERYKNLLDAEYAKTSTHVRESIRKFNIRVEDFLLEKIKVAAAICQENIIKSRLSVRLMRRLKLNDNELGLKKSMMSNEELIQGLHSLITSLHDALADCKTQLENVQNREKNIEKLFKKDLAEVPAIYQDQVIRMLKKRPKVSFKNVNSPTVLKALALCILTTNQRSPMLTQECIDYLNGLDTFDANVGSTLLDETGINVLRKHRRCKIEQEIKVKAANAVVSEAELTIALLQKRLNQKKEENVKFMSDLAQVRTDRISEMKDIEVQLIMKQGFVELNLTGDISDFKDAVLVSRNDVEEVNKLILENGTRKLNAMRHTMSFHREIMKTEWIHKKMRMQIEDLKEVYNDISLLKVTKDMQTYLKAKEKLLPFEVEVEILKNSYEFIINEKKEQVQKLRKQINLLKVGNKKLDRDIADINLDVCEFTLDRDFKLEEKEKQLIEERINILFQRGKVIRQVQANHNHILMLQTELEILRLKTYPTIKYKILT